MKRIFFTMVMMAVSAAVQTSDSFTIHSPNHFYEQDYHNASNKLEELFKQQALSRPTGSKNFCSRFRVSQKPVDEILQEKIQEETTRKNIAKQFLQHQDEDELCQIFQNVKQNCHNVYSGKSYSQINTPEAEELIRHEQDLEKHRKLYMQYIQDVFKKLLVCSPLKN